MGDDEILNMYLLCDCAYAVVVPDCLYVHQNNTGGKNTFHMNAMDELNIIKSYQATNLEKYKVKNGIPVREIQCMQNLQVGHCHEFWDIQLEKKQIIRIFRKKLKECCS